MDLSTLFGGGTANPLALVESIFQQMVGELARHDGVADVDGTPPEDLLATTLGKRLAGMILEDRAAAPTGLPALDPAYPTPVQDEQLVDRMLALAAALGACDCWGQDVGCPVCEGAGSPGWLPPDRHLFAAYVYPAMRAVRRADDASGTTARTNRNGAVVWKSDNDSGATVDAQGVVTGVKAGSTTITATLGTDFDKKPVVIFDPTKTPTK
jgi:Bacterial Ig-like domain (group 2)